MSLALLFSDWQMSEELSNIILLYSKTAIVFLCIILTMQSTTPKYVRILSNLE